METLPINAMTAGILQLKKKYSSNNPFPHVVIEDYWDEPGLSKVADECGCFSNWDEEKNFYGSIGKRSCSTLENLPPVTAQFVSYCNSSKFLIWLEHVTGEKGLIPDPYLYGGGIHSTINKGFLKMHADFNWHPILKLYRRLNLLIYLNRDWQDSWGGELQLARLTDEGLITEVSIAPRFNTTVLFTTTDLSFHGHPDPMTLPPHHSRNSIALYYYVSSKPDDTSEERRLETDYRTCSGAVMSG